jgi:hypothetical protein
MEAIDEVEIPSAVAGFASQFPSRAICAGNWQAFRHRVLLQNEVGTRGRVSPTL